MAEIYPFSGMYYNPSRVNDLATVICPPYDIISQQMQHELYRQSEYNFVRLEYGREFPQDSARDNKYTRSSSTLQQWLKQGIFTVDEKPAIYLHHHYFQHQGKECRRQGIITIVRLEEWDKKVVRPHEGTLSQPKSDRLNLLWTLQLNTSPILSLFEDREQTVTSLLDTERQGEPALDFNTATGERHTIWAITRKTVINQICNRLANQPLYIADGHHRYESALTYRREMAACSSSDASNKPYNFVMMTLVDFSDPGLVILPAHRLVRGMSKSTLDELMPKLAVFFDIEELPLNASDIPQQVDNLLTEEENQIKLILLGPSKELLFVLRLRNLTTASQMIPYFHSELYKSLEVSIVDHVIIEKLLGLGSDMEEASLTYNHDKFDTVNKVLGGEYQLAFLLNPIKAKIIKAIADAGDRMPRKSTYFYPKLPAGLVCHRLV